MYHEMTRNAISAIDSTTRTASATTTRSPLPRSRYRNTSAVKSAATTAINAMTMMIFKERTGRLGLER